MLNKNSIVTYSLLAHINDNEAGIKDFSDVFVPLVTRALSKMYNNGTKGGQLPDLKLVVDKQCNLDIPYPFLNKIIRKIETEQTKNKPPDFVVNSDNSFQIHLLAFTDYEELVNEQETELDWLEEKYKTFLGEQGVDPHSEPSIYEFIDQNRLELSTYVTHRRDVDDSLDFNHQISFVNSIKSDSKEFSILKKVYIGSIIASYLEIEIDLKESSGVELLLDTSFIIGLLDLSSVESNHTCTAIVRLAHALGYRVTILDITINEINVLLKGDSNQARHSRVHHTFRSGEY